MKYFIQTFGCAMNTTDSERVASVLERLGFSLAQDKAEADFLVFNTCSIRQKAEDRVLGLRKELKAFRKANPDFLVAITGCMTRKTSTQADESGKDDLLRTMPEVDIIFQIDHVARIPELLKKVRPSLEFADDLDEGTLENYFKIAPKKQSPASVFVPVMTGCDKFCTYCIVPYSRGREKSRNFEDILQECEKHVKEGALEITLVGQTVNTYGLSFQDKKSGEFERFEGSPFAHLLRAVDALQAFGLKRLRFTSPHPRDFHDDVIEAMAECTTVCPYFHMPIQSGDDAVLRRMNRNYKAEEYKSILRKIREKIPNVAISTDIIVGFCGETDEEFENTYNMYKEMAWDWCYLARYSPRKGTYSEKKLADDVPREVKAERWHRLNKLMVSLASQKYKAYEGQEVEVLVSSQIGELCEGRTPDFKEVKLKSGRNIVGQIVRVKVTQVRELLLIGELL